MLDLSLYPPHAALDADGRLTLAGCPVSEVAREHGTPAYLVDAATCGSVRCSSRPR